jgi:hypothetical protein
MNTKSVILGLLMLVLPANTSFAGDGPIVGSWKLKSYVREAAGSGERYNLMGEHPHGYLHYLPDGRMSAILVWDNRIKPGDVTPTDDERIKLHRSMTAYAGTYTLQADKIIHHVDISWNEAWTGTDQIRFYKLEGDTLTITSALAKHPSDGREGRSVLVWEKVKAPGQ